MKLAFQRGTLFYHGRRGGGEHGQRSARVPLGCRTRDTKSTPSGRAGRVGEAGGGEELVPQSERVMGTFREEVKDLGHFLVTP